MPTRPQRTQQLRVNKRKPLPINTGTAEARRKIEDDRRKGFRGANRKAAKLAILVRDGHACCECGKLVEMGTSHMDHIVPLIAGGTHTEDNLQTLCLRCSYRKTARETRVYQDAAGGPEKSFPKLGAQGGG